MSFENDDNNPWGSKKPRQRPQTNPFDDLINKAKKRMRGGSGSGGLVPPNAGFLASILAGFVFLGWLATGFYIIETDQQGVVLRFGAMNRTSNSGLNFKWPSPIEVVYAPRVEKVNIINSGVGVAVKQQGDAPDDRVMLTGDENIVNIEFTIQWKIKDAAEFVLNTRSPEMTLKVAGESVMREVVGQTPILSIVSGSGWAEINAKAQGLLQSLCDGYKLGVQVINIKLQKASPPEAVNEAFQDVQNARTDKARLSNEAESYRNDILPRARAEAIRIIQDAQAYKEALVAQAEGEANRFKAVLSEYEKNPEVTLKRMQLANMQKVFEKNNKIFVDPAIGKNFLQVLPGLNLKSGEGK